MKYCPEISPQRKAQLDAWMRRPDWLRGAAKARFAEAMRHPPHSHEHLRHMAIAAQYERDAEAGDKR
jgi:hypothetical protein